MPYARNSELPKGVRDALPSEAQTVYRTVYNENEDKGESGAAAIAWTAVKNGWKKDEDGAWVRKSDEMSGWRAEFKIRKLDSERRFVFGWANVAVRVDGEQIQDYQADMIDPEDLELAGYDFVLNSRETGEMHEGGAKGYMIESFVVTPEKLQMMGLAPDALPIGWWVAFYVADDDAWAKVKDGTYTMFSIEGSAVREEVS